MKKKIVVLGATGSIGKQTLDLLRYNKDYELVGVSFNSNISKIEEELLYFPTLKTIAIADNKKAFEFKKNHTAYDVITSDDVNVKLIDLFKDAIIVNALMGNVGLFSTLKAIENNQILLLSNKESLVIGSKLIKESLKTSKTKIYPIDSEHVALAKLLTKLKEKGIKKKGIKKLIVTASGGALRHYPLSKIDDVKKEEVLHHPTWNMSNKITIDSATLVNKAYEVIEASILFDFPLKKVGAIVCEESLIHAEIIYLENGKEEKIVELSPCDMKVAINYALSFGKEKMHPIWDGDKKILSSLHIYDVDNKRYPLFEYALSIYAKYKNIGMLVFNHLDSSLINEYLKDNITFKDIEKGLKLLPSYLDKLDIELNATNLKEIEKEATKISSSIIKTLKR